MGVACSVSSPNPDIIIDGDAATSPTPSGTSTTPSPSGKDASTSEPDAAPVIDKTVKFDFTIDGETPTIESATATIVPATSTDPAMVKIAGQYEQDEGFGLTSTATFTIWVQTGYTGTDACDEKTRYATYLFKDTDGAIKELATDLLGGSCTMKVLSTTADGFTSGSATGTLGGDSTKAFTIAWGQPIPQ